MGVFLTYTKRFSNNWDLMASYSYSKSWGMNPRFFSGGYGGSQGSTFYSSRTEADPNTFIGADSDKLLAGDRRHILRLVGNIMLPYQFKINSVVNIQTGRTYDRQQWVQQPDRGWSQIMVSPTTDDQRFPDQFLWDLGVGKHFNLGRGTDLSIYLQILNIFNDGAIEGWWDNKYPADQEPIPDQWVLPRRAQLRLRFAF